MVLYRLTVVGGQILGGNKVDMLHNLQLGMVGIQPFWQMSVCHDVYLVHPRRKHLYASEPVLQIVPSSVSGITVINLLMLQRGIVVALFPPFEVVAVNPGDDKIYFFFHILPSFYKDKVFSCCNSLSVLDVSCVGATSILLSFNAFSIPSAMASAEMSVIYPLGLPFIWSTPQKSVHTMGLAKHKASPRVIQKLSCKDG